MDIERVVCRLVADASQYNKAFDQVTARLFAFGADWVKFFSQGAFEAAAYNIQRAFSRIFTNLNHAPWFNSFKTQMAGFVGAFAEAGTQVAKFMRPVTTFFSYLGPFLTSSVATAGAAFSSGLYRHLVVPAAAVGLRVVAGLRPIGTFFSYLGPFIAYQMSGIGTALSGRLGGLGTFLGAGGSVLGRGGGAVAGFGGSILGAIGSGAASVGMGVFSTALKTAQVGLLALTAAAGVAGYEAVRLASDYEQTAIAFEVMTGSAEKAKFILAEIDKYAISSPFKSAGLTQAAQGLKAMGIETDQLIPTLKVLGEVAAGTSGGSLDDRMKRISLAFGQVRTAGRLMGGEIRQFVNAGVPLIEYLALVMNQPEASIRKMVSSGEVGFNEVIRAFNKMTAEGGIFANMTERQSQTVAGRWSAAVETVQLALRNLGLSFFKGFGAADLLKGFAESAGDLGRSTDQFEAFFGRVRQIFDDVATAASAAGSVIAGAFGETFQKLFANDRWEDFRDNFRMVIKVMVVAVGELLDTLRDLMNFMAKSVIRPAGAAIESAGLGESKGVYTTSRESGYNVVHSGLRAGVTGLISGLYSMSDSLWDQRSSDYYNKQLVEGGYLKPAPRGNALTRMANNLENATTVPEGKESWADKLAKRLQTAFDSLDKNARGATTGIDALAGGLGGFARETRGAGEQMKEILSLSPKALQLGDKVRAEYKKGEQGYERFSSQFKMLEEAFRGPVGGAAALAGGALLGVKNAGGVLDRDQYRFGLMQIYDDMLKVIPQGMGERMAPVALAGTAEAQDTIARTQSQLADVAERVAADVAAAKAILEERQDYERRVADALEDLAQKGVIVPRGVKP